MGKRKGLLMSSQLRSAVFSAILLFGCRKIDIPVQMKNPTSVEGDMFSIPSPLQARPFPPTCVSCGLSWCCRNTYACKLLGRDVLHGFPCPGWTRCCIFSTPAFGDVSSCRPAKNMGTTWLKPNEWEADAGGPEPVSRGWLKNK